MYAGLEENDMHDPVMADLGRHLAEQDKQEAFAEAVESKADELMMDADEVSSVVLDQVLDDLASFADKITAVITATTEDRQALIDEFFGNLTDRVRAAMDDLAADKVREADAQAAQDQAECRSMDREDYLPF